MRSRPIDNLAITPDKTGARRFTKVSYPIRYGRYGEIQTPAFTFQFNLNREIKHIQGRGTAWPSPSEWLKRSVGNDWVYYLAGDYSGVKDAFGEYYFPFPAYPTNAFITRNPFNDPSTAAAFRAWQQIRETAAGLVPGINDQALKCFLESVAATGPAALDRRARHFHRIIGGRISVLPPDARHVDYDVIPVIVADGCLYKCGFCRVKSRDGFVHRTRKNIITQLAQLKKFLGPDLKNYNAVFLGLHDALNADPDLLLFAAENAYTRLGLASSLMADDARLFLFGSVDALINARGALFDALQALPYLTYINIGMESADPDTLNRLQKPISAEKVTAAFDKMLGVNHQYSRIEITANFVYGDTLPSGHLPAFFKLTRQPSRPLAGKGTLYFSPLMTGGRMAHQDIVRRFYKIKARNPFDNYLYLIQRL